MSTLFIFWDTLKNSVEILTDTFFNSFIIFITNLSFHICKKFLSEEYLGYVCLAIV